MRPLEFRTEAEALAIKMEIKAACPTGDVVSTNGLRVTVTTKGQIVASGSFDFTDAPMYLPRPDSSGSTVIREFRYPPGSFWRIPSTSGSRSTATASSAATGDQLVECEDQGVSRGPESSELPTTPASAPVTASRPVLPANTDSETVSLDALREQAAADRPLITSDIADRWVPQISSKRVGLAAPDVDGRMVHWTATEILNQHLRMRLMYPNVRLAWSDEWRSFDLAGWWVTLTGITSGDPDTANRWCDSKGIAADECFAKLVSNTRDSTGTTKYRR